MGTSDELGISNNYELGGGEKKVEVVKRLEASRFVGWLKKNGKRETGRWGSPIVRTSSRSKMQAALTEPEFCSAGNR